MGTKQFQTPSLSALLLTILLCLGCQNSGSHLTQGVRSFQQGNTQAAAQRFQQAIALNPRDADAYYNLAATYHSVGRRNSDGSLLRQAESIYHQCLDVEPNHVNCHRALAVLLVDTDRPRSAFTLLERWADRNPKYAEAKVELARLHEEFGEQQTARRYLTEAIDVNPQNARAWTALGRLREQQGQLAQALNNYEQAYRLNHYQPGLATRIATLQTRMSGGPAAPNTRMVDNSNGWQRR